MKKYGWLCLLILSLLCATSVLAGYAAGHDASGKAENEKMDGQTAETLAYWNPSSPAMQSLISYVNDVTDPKSDSYISAKDRIAVFDLDGTLYGERYPTYVDQCLMLHRYLHDPTFTPAKEDAEYCRRLEAAVRNGTEAPSSPRSSGQMIAESFQGFTVEEYRAYIREFLKTDIPGFTGMTYGDRFFQPMVSVVRYLYEHDFQVYIVSGAERSLLRELITGTLDEYIPSDRVIGTTFSLTATNQGDVEGRKYIYGQDDAVLMEGNMTFKNLSMNKVVSIVDEIGKPPVLAFGNSSGDFAMAEYTVQHGGRAYMLLCDDTERDFGDVEEAEAFRQDCEARGFVTVSMRDEFATIYAEGVKKGAYDKVAPVEETIEGWAPDSPAMQSIVEFVMDSVDESSDGFIPKSDRIAVFDMDGTLYGERFPTYFNDWLFIQRALYDDSYETPKYLEEFARAWEDKVLRGIPIENFDAKERELGPKLYQGLTQDAYAEVVRRFKALPVWGFEGMTYGEAYFQPMVSLVKYLYEHDYSIYIVSATYRDAVRVMTEGVLDQYIPYDHVIGTDLLYVSSGDEESDSMFYELKPQDKLVIAGELFIKNQKTNKATVIQQEIGKLPVLAFGNSTGDFSMATYTLQNGKYGGRAYMLLCDDTERDYGDPAIAAAFKNKCDANDFYTISMKDEFETLYPDGANMARPGQDAAA